MGPLVPNIISNEFNLIVALIAGIGFGFTLEQAGFSSTKKIGWIILRLRFYRA